MLSPPLTFIIINTETVNISREIRPLVFDREFSYLILLHNLVEAEVQFVIRLNLGANPVQFSYVPEQKRPLQLWIAPINKPRIFRQVYYLGKVCLNVGGSGAMV
jgi:hypothetical protein